MTPAFLRKVVRQPDMHVSESSVFLTPDFFVVEFIPKLRKLYLVESFFFWFLNNLTNPQTVKHISLTPFPSPPPPPILNSFAKLRKATVFFAVSFRPSVRMEQFGSHWTDFDKILYFSFF
jgi:hypothetical protein